MLPVFSMFGEADDTVLLTSTDVAQGLSASLLTVGGKPCKTVMITIESNPVKLAFGGATPVQGAGNLGHVIQKDGSPVYLVGSYMISSLKYISAINGQHGKVSLTPFY